MKLNKLEIIGFKSFPTKTSFEFDSGIVGIVGPNGCGKTNVLEAIEWVLGEQNPFNLRGEKMEDFIFKGSEKYKPLNFAEVTAVIENDGLLPISYEEVAITRRFYRSGESEYFINRSNVRLKDIVNLFLNTGLKAEAYSIFRSEMIETILSSNSKARRGLFEEAAEIAKYKSHKKNSLAKLELTKTDLIRVNDILEEVEKQWRSLKRQVGRSKKYREINLKLKENRLMLSYLEYEMFSKEIAHIEKEIELERESREEQLSIIESLEAELQEETANVREMSQSASSLIEDDNRTKEEVRRIKENLIVLGERGKSILSQKVYIEKENDFIRQKITEIRNLVDEKKKEDLKKTDEIAKMEAENGERKERVSLLETEFMQKKSDYEDAREKKENSTTKIDELKERQISETADAKNREEIISSLNLELSELDCENKKTKQELVKLETELREKKEEEKRTRDKLSKKRESWDRFEESKRKKHSELIHLEERQNILREEADFLKSFQKDRKGYDELVKTLNRKQSLSILADIIDISKDKKEALAGVLESLIQTVILTDKKKLNDVLRMAEGKDVRIGILLGFVDSEATQAIQEKGVIGRLSDYLNVKAEKEIIKQITNFFDRFFLCETIDDAIELYKKHSKCNFVTLKGDVVSGGVLFVGKGAHRELIGLGDKIMKNIEEMKQLKNLMEEKTVEMQKIEKEQKESSKKFEQVNIEFSKCSVMLKESEIVYEKKCFENEMNIKRIVKLKDELKSAKQSLKILEGNVLNNERVFRQEDTELSIIFQDEVESGEAFRESQDQLQVFREGVNKGEIKIVELKGEAKATREMLRAKLKELNDSTEKLDENISRIKNFEEELAEITMEEEVLKKEKVVIGGREQKLNEQLVEIGEKKEGMERKIEEVKEKKEGVIDNEKGLYEKISELNIEKVKLEAERKNIESRVKQEYEVDISHYDGEVSVYAKDKVSEEIKILEERKRRFGPVNLMAIEDLARIESRREDLLTQKTDLLEARKDLFKTIEHIDSVAKEKFLSTFNNVRENFKIIFNKLFESGESDLLLSGSDPLEADITIVAKPKHKEVGKLASLSTGERTLIAISLLFAFYLIKPSPICVLDEIDAPLDDANVERFISLLGDFREKSQLIVITHNKMTMKCADYLYGITMTEPNVSTVASVRIS